MILKNILVCGGYVYNIIHIYVVAKNMHPASVEIKIANLRSTVDVRR